ncbi:MAG: glycosyltransferase family 39 protein, partial [Chloroflexota bacterium]
MNRKQFVILLFIIFIAFTLRVHLLGNQELRGDEGFSWNYIQDPIQEIVPRILREGDPQPPIHYWLLWLWVKFTGDSEFAMRAWSTMLSLMLVPLTYHFARKFWDNDSTVAIIAASIMAIHPQQIWLAQDVRNMYQLALAPLLVATIVLPKIVEQRLRKSGLITSLRAFFAKQ